MPDQGTYRPRVVRRGGRGGGGGYAGYRNMDGDDGGGYRNNVDGGRRGPPRGAGADTRPEKEVLENGGGDLDARPQRRRYPRFMDPVRRRPTRGYRSGGVSRRSFTEDNQETRDDGHGDHGDHGDEPQDDRRQRPRQQRNRRQRRPRITSNNQTDSARENSGAETDEHDRHDNDGDAGGVGADGEKKAGKSGRNRGDGRRRRSRPPRTQQSRGNRGRRSRLPRVYTPEEFNKVTEPVEKLSKRVGDKKADTDDEEINDAIKELVKYYEESEIKNAYELTLKLLMVAVGFDNADSLYAPILRALDLVLHGEDANNALTAEVQGAAFVLSRVQELASCASELGNLYELTGASGEKLKALITELLKFHLYKQALHEVVENGLEKEFTVEQVVVPLVIQHYINPVEEMLKKNTHYLEPLIAYLDRIVALTYAEMTAEVEKFDVPYVIGLGRQFLVRIILGWHGQFKFDMKLCPNIRMFFAKTHLYYLNRRRFRIVDLPYVNWMELVVELVRENNGLAREMVDELVRYNQSPEAKYWAKIFDVKKEEMAEPVIQALEAVQDEFDIEEAKKTGLKPREGRTFYEIEIKDDAVQFVDKEAECARVLGELLKKGKVGIDVEWKPDTGLLPNVVSVLQLSTEEKVYVFDVKALKSGSALVDGLNNMLLDEGLVKIGFNISRDIAMLERSLSTELKFQEAKNIADLRVLQDKFYKGLVDFLFPNANRKDFKRRAFSGYEVRQARGLNSLVKAVFDGKSLDRAELISNWENRPLRPSQLKFAARDALVLIKLHDQLAEEAKKNEKDWEELLKPLPPSRGRGDGGAGRSNEEEGTDSAGEKTGEESGRSSRNEGGRLSGGPRRGGGLPRPFGGRRYTSGGYGGAPRGRGRGGRFRGGGRGGFFGGPPRVRLTAPNGERYPPASQKEEILDNGKVPDIMSSPKKPKELKIITDSMLLGLGKALKARGFDVVVLQRKDRHEACVDGFKSENRVILTQGRIFYDMKDQVSPGYCFKVVNRKVEDQVEEVLEAYQVELDEEAAAEAENGEAATN